MLAYAETPPYLRRILFSQRDELACAGVLPPLNTPHHKAGGTPRIGDVRDGYATEHGVEIGADRPAKAAGDPGEGRVTVEIVGKESGRFVVTRRRGPPPAYWGFDVRRADSLTAALDAYDVTIATSRKGEETLEVKADGSVAVAFGSPGRGLEELLAGEDRTRGAIPHWYNAVPNQGTDTIRTEEAVYLALEPVRKLLIAQGR